MRLTAGSFFQRLQELQSDEERLKITRYFKSGEGQYGEGDQFLGVRMGQVFDLAKEFQAMAASELEDLLESPVHEARARRPQRSGGRNSSISTCGATTGSTAGIWSI